MTDTPYITYLCIINIDIYMHIYAWMYVSVSVKTQSMSNASVMRKELMLPA